jgi:redox-regulated HSP33 family molecular chaperone
MSSQDAQPTACNVFLLKGAPVRAEIVSLDGAWRQVVEPPAARVRARLPGRLSAALLLAASLKFGSLVLQII